MLDCCYCFTRGGVLLWSFCFAKLQDSPLNQLIETVLLEERVGSTCASLGGYCFQWSYLNSLQLIFVAAYRGVRHVAKVDRLLQQTAGAFEHHIHGIDNALDYPLRAGPARDSFDDIFLHIMSKAQQREQDDFTVQQQEQQRVTTKEFKSTKKAKEKSSTQSTSNPKELARWFWAGEDKVTRKKMDALDYRAHWCVVGIDWLPRAVSCILCTRAGGDSDYQQSDESANASADSGWLSLLPKSLQKLTGNKLLVESDIEDALPFFRQHFSSKNVAEEVIDLLLSSVRTSLLGTRTATLTTVHQTIKAALRESIGKILTPRKSMDVLRLCMQARAEGRVFSIVFLGINGVGKSTNLAKVAYHLKHKGGLNVLIAACDTFRAGAVEQLQAHARCLDVPLFERGYGKDAAAICREALSHAHTIGADVVLIDTAGRMQDNEPLMRALGKLVQLNNPDLILFVGEALVGNDAVDQLKKFNQALVASSRGPSPRLIDGILLTKFDTVGDKVGAALSMAYITGQPVVFVGTGQKYQNLKKLSVRRSTPSNKLKGRIEALSSSSIKNHVCRMSSSVLSSPEQRWIRGSLGFVADRDTDEYPAGTQQWCFTPAISQTEPYNLNLPSEEWVSLTLYRGPQEGSASSDALKTERQGPGGPEDDEASGHSGVTVNWRAFSVGADRGPQGNSPMLPFLHRAPYSRLVANQVVFVGYAGSRPHSARELSAQLLMPRARMPECAPCVDRLARYDTIKILLDVGGVERGLGGPLGHNHSLEEDSNRGVQSIWCIAHVSILARGWHVRRRTSRAPRTTEGGRVKECASAGQ
ncbi:hypothetical protein Esti_003090 [Eimeria stiedai]